MAAAAGPAGPRSTPLAKEAQPKPPVDSANDSTKKVHAVGLQQVDAMIDRMGAVNKSTDHLEALLAKGDATPEQVQLAIHFALVQMQKADAKMQAVFDKSVGAPGGAPLI